MPLIKPATTAKRQRARTGGTNVPVMNQNDNDVRIASQKSFQEAAIHLFIPMIISQKR